jgi:hypothetical protein
LPASTTLIPSFSGYRTPTLLRRLYANCFHLPAAPSQSREQASVAHRTVLFEMQLSAIILLASSAAAQLGAQSFNAPVDPFGGVRKRQLLSCEQTYGRGSINCGGSGSTFCFNPSLGQVRSQPYVDTDVPRPDANIAVVMLQR